MKTICIRYSSAVLLLFAFSCQTVTAQVQATRMVPTRPAMRTITVMRNGQPVTMTVPANMSAQQMRALTQGSANVAGGSAAGDEGEDTSATGMLAGLADDKKEQIKVRLEQLWLMPLNRTPSAMLRQWSKSSLGQHGIRKSKPNEDLPPGPLLEDLLNDERFVAFQADIAQMAQAGDWAGIREKTSFFDEPNQRRLFRRILSALTAMPEPDPNMIEKAAQRGAQLDPNSMESQFLPFREFFELLTLSPDRPLKNEDLQTAGALAGQILKSGCSVSSLLENVRSEIARPAEEQVITNGGAARLLFYAGQLDASGEFLPNAEEAFAAGDFSTMNFICEQLLAVHAKEGKAATLEQAWTITQQVLTAENVPDKEYDPALDRAVSLAVRIRTELGQEWLNESFTADPVRGIRILSAIGDSAATSMMMDGMDPKPRLEILKLQRDAVKALLNVAAEQAESWRPALELMAVSWLRESSATYQFDTSTSYTPGMQRDMYGNIFYSNPYQQDFNPRGNGLTAISTGELLEVRPDDRWLEFVSPSLRPKFDTVFAQLYLKVSEEEKALPYIESLVKTNPDLSEQLAEEFLQVWTRNHDPNSDRGRSDMYMYMYGFESRAESIPLTRSKQQRNLAELADLVPRLSKICNGELNQDLVATAFLACHSYAEVYKLADIERVFGNFDEIKPEVIGSLASGMRANLASVWRQIETQQNAKTKRNPKEIIAEVMRGYEVARDVIDRGLKAHPGNWSLLLNQAMLLHDLLNYEAEQQRSSSFADNQRIAMTSFQQAAESYAGEVGQLEQKEYQTEVFERWFYASLGASDLNLVDAKHNTDESQASLIRAAIESLPGETAEWHMNRFANLLFNRLSNCQPAVKQRYLRSAFEIVGDNVQARKAREVFDYYSDLVTEIRLDAVIDGSVQVGEKPFGVFVNLNHTREIERESGGFAKYLQNQNSSAGFFYNYGRPTEDYRDRFEEHVRDKMKDSFEVVSVTFQVPEVQSHQGSQPGWRVTPYAYLLLRAKGPQVDSIPRMRLDLDFLDTSGYAVLPVETAPVLIDAKKSASDARPWSNLQVRQILDERQADEGKLILEVKATSRGLVPDFQQLFGQASFGDFAVKGEVEDDGVVISQFDPEADTNVVTSERSWIVTLLARDGLTEKPRDFHFLQTALETNETVYQRYDDADLKAAEQVVSLERKYAAPAATSIWTKVLIGVGSLAALLTLIIVVMLVNRRPSSTSLALPENISPFALISMLRQVETGNGLNEKRRTELGDSIRKLESWYFAKSGQAESDHPDLNRIAKTWLTPATLNTVLARSNGNGNASNGQHSV